MSKDERGPAPLRQDLAAGDLANAGWKLLRHLRGGDDVRTLRKLVGRDVPQSEIDALLDELASAEELRAALRSPAVERWNAAGGTIDGDLRALFELDSLGRGRFVVLYAATRLLKPEVVVETGCFTGRDSAALLLALERNGRGHLHTIDLPAAQGALRPTAPDLPLPDDVQPGFLVPDELRHRWTLTLGDAVEELPALLRSLPRVDLFLHDSEHTYAHMIWEYSSAWRRLAPGGIIVSDDISWNTAFWDFARGVGAPLVIHRATPNVGALRRPVAGDGGSP